MGIPPTSPPPLAATDAQLWAERFAVLADPTRLRILTHMHLHPGCTVTELAAAADISATTTSQSLKGMRDRGWITTARDGRQMRYTLVDEVAHRALHFMGQAHQDDHPHH